LDYDGDSIDALIGGIKKDIEDFGDEDESESHEDEDGEVEADADEESESEEPAAAPKKVTVKRITIDGKQYLKTADNLLYDPETKEEMGIYDPETNTIKELPDDDEDEVEEDGYSSE
jgi:hypothetical protein